MKSSNPKILILADQAVFSGTNFLLTILLARTLDVAAFGRYSAVVLAMYLIVSVLNAIVVQVVQVQAAAQKDSRAYISFSFWLQTVVLSGILLVGGLVYRFLPLSLSLWTVLPLIWGFVMHDYFRKTLIALGRTTQVLTIDILAAVAQIGALVALFWLKGSLNLYLLLMGVAYVLPFVYGVFVLRPLLWSLRGQWSGFAALHFTEGKWLLGSALVQWWAGNLFVVASGIYLGAQALGGLRLVQSLFGILNVLLQTFENYVLPTTATLLAKSRNDAAHYLVRTTQTAAILFVPVLLATAFFPKQIMQLVGGEVYMEYGFLLTGMACNYVLIYLAQPIRISIRVLLLNEYFFYGYVLTLIFALSSSDFLLSNYGLIGVLVGLLSSQLILIVFWQLTLNNKKGFFSWKSFISF
ncbi:hypothetical protein SAMN05421780_10817 [Flexibacter flexilis DSM 6793]|uniref:Membrane protein involved in the export of O-antigen and teichoic acid n=1 Tax=Flexibacter flexilis DSM 6793 TaxID=927664 RepID=A0A1I1LBS0_9BACT|nr:hypothetical protein [Flexibacter flexilis]SFC66980.1 hypothetical protein SAMN05421780_10817 [Flexibacter flexilis DSM 6793]